MRHTPASCPPCHPAALRFLPRPRLGFGDHAGLPHCPWWGGGCDRPSAAPALPRSATCLPPEKIKGITGATGAPTAASRVGRRGDRTLGLSPSRPRLPRQEPAALVLRPEDGWEPGPVEGEPQALRSPVSSLLLVLRDVGEHTRAAGLLTGNGTLPGGQTPVTEPQLRAPGLTFGPHISRFQEPPGQGEASQPNGTSRTELGRFRGGRGRCSGLCAPRMEGDWARVPELVQSSFPTLG